MYTGPFIGVCCLPQAYPNREDHLRITKSTIRDLKLPRGVKDHIFFDDDVPGFGLRVRASGAQTWIAQYSVGRKARKVSLGSPAQVDISKAREAAKDIFAKVRLGTDPAKEKAEARAKLADTFSYHLQHKAKDKDGKDIVVGYLPSKVVRVSTRRELERYLLVYAKPLHHRPVEAISRRDIAVLLHEVNAAHGGASANKLGKALAAFFTWAMQEGLVEANPASVLNKAPENGSRERVLADRELAAVWQALGSDQYSDIIRLLLLTGCRREEIGGLRWNEVHTEASLIALPSERTKNGKPHDVPLSPAAVAILKAREAGAGSRTFVFGTADRGFQDWSGSKRDLDAWLVAAGTPVEGWRLHDLRRTLSTVMHDKLGIEPHIVEAILSHTNGHKAGVAGVYNRASYGEQKRAALLAWAEWIESIVRQQSMAA
jgi:integrase